ncbi:MAG: agmatinase [Planctomycetota bacterium]
MVPRYEHVPDNFGALAAELADYESARVAVLPVPYESTVTFGGGARRGPRAIIEASQNTELYDGELEREPLACGVATLPPMETDVRGPEFEIARVEQAVRGVVEDGKIPALLGGEHSISLGAVRALAGRFGDLSVLQIDAHLDLRDSYQGSPFSHACVARRCLELVPVVQVGVRSVSEEEHRFVAEEGLEPFYAWDLEGRTDWIPRVLSRLSPNVYVTVDLDGLDPSLCGAVGTPEPGGLSWRQITSVIRALGEKARIVGFDIVELSPHEFSLPSNVVAAKVTFRLIAAAI